MIDMPAKGHHRREMQIQAQCLQMVHFFAVTDDEQPDLVEVAEEC
jgi:hypothetical protein